MYKIFLYVIKLNANEMKKIFYIKSFRALVNM